MRLHALQSGAEPFSFVSIKGVFSGNLSLDITEGSLWKLKRSGFCGMRSKKVTCIDISTKHKCGFCK